MHELYLALNLLNEETKDRAKLHGQINPNLPVHPSPSVKFAQRVLDRYRKAKPHDSEAVRQNLFDQALIELQKAMNLIEMPHWTATRRWDVLDVLVSVRNTMREMEEHIHARASD